MKLRSALEAQRAAGRPRPIRIAVKSPVEEPKEKKQVVRESARNRARSGSFWGRLVHFALARVEWPFPNEWEVEELRALTGCSERQLEMWFENMRVNVWEVAVRRTFRGADRVFVVGEDVGEEKAAMRREWLQRALEEEGSRRMLTERFDAYLEMRRNGGGGGV